MVRGRALVLFASASLIAGATTFCGGDEFVVAPLGNDDGGDTVDGSGSGSIDGSGSSSGGKHDGSGGEDGSKHDGSSSGGDDAPSGDDDATTDGADDASTGFSCANPPVGTLFCADFDNPNVPQQGWGPTGTPPISFGNGSTNSFDTSHFLTSPHGYQASVGVNAGASAAALQNDNLISGKSILDYAFSIYLTAEDTLSGTETTIARLLLGQAFPRPLFIDLQIDAAGLHVVQTAATADGGQTVQDDVAHGKLALNQWYRIRLTLNRGAVAPKVSVTFDETSTFDTTLVPATTTSNQLGIELGIIYAQPPTQGTTITYDNVLLRGL